jgi:hypothetical protein
MTHPVTPHVRVGVVVVAVAAAVLTYLAMWALLFVVCLYDAGGDSSFLPSPSSWTLRSVYLAVAILVGLLTFRACRKRELSVRQATVPGGLALVAVLVVSGSTYAYGVSREHNYLTSLPPGMSREAGLAYGHQACDWLAARPWGRPPGSDFSFQVPPVLGSMGKVKTLVYDPPRMRWRWFGSRSTDRLIVYYIEHLDAQHPGPLTRNERQHASVIDDAWFELCPFQQWVHRPVGGSGD